MLRAASDRPSFQRKDHPVSADDQHSRRAARQGRREHRHLEGARRRGSIVLTAMYNPTQARARDRRVHRHRRAARDAARRRSSMSRGYKNADALVHVVRAFRDAVGAAPVRLDRSGARRAGDGGRADPRGPRRGRAAARAHREGSEEGHDRRSSNTERDLVQRCKDALEDGTPLRALAARRRRSASGCAASSSSRPSRCCS